MTTSSRRCPPKPSRASSRSSTRGSDGTSPRFFLLRVDPAVGSRQLDGYLRQGDSHGRAIRRTAMVRRKKERAGFLVALPGRTNELRLLLSATMVDEVLDPVVVPDVQVPSIARRVAALGRVFHRHQLSPSPFRTAIAACPCLVHPRRASPSTHGKGR